MENTKVIRDGVPRYAVINDDGTYAGVFCLSLEEALDLAGNGGQKRHIYELKEVAE